MAKVAEQKAVVCYIGLGSNLGPREDTIRRAVDLLRGTSGIRVLKVSRLEETMPIGPAQPPFINAVAAIETQLEPLELLDRLQSIENHLGRVRESHWGPRTIDLDLLYYGDQTISHPRLTVPHPQIARRDFVRRGLEEAGYRA